MNRNYVFLVIAVICVISLCACGKKEINVDTNPNMNESVVQENKENEEIVYEDIRSDKKLRLRVKDKKYGAVNENEETIIDFKYDYLYLTDNQYVISQIGEHYGIIDIEGKEIIPCEYEKAYPEILGGKPCFLVEINGKCGLVDINNEIILPIDYDEIMFNYDEEDEGYTPYSQYVTVKKENKYGIINVKDKNIKKCEYDRINKLISIDGKSYFATKKDGYTGVIDGEHNEVIPYEYNYIECIKINYDEQPFFIVEKDYKKGIFNIEGKAILPCEYSYISGSGKSDTKTYFSITNGKYGIADSDGNIVVDCQYDNFVRYIGNGLFEVSNGKYNKVKEKSTKYGIVNENKEEVFPCIYTDLSIQKTPKITLLKIEKSDEKNFVIFCNDEVVYSNNNYDNVYFEFEYNMLGLASFNEDNVKYIVTENGEKYEDCSNILNGPRNSYIIRKDNKYGIINTENKKIDAEYDKIEEVCDMSIDWLKWYYVEKDNKFGLVNDKLELVIPCEIDKENLLENKSHMFFDTGCIVKSGDKYGVINKNIEMTIPYMYDEIDIFSYSVDVFLPDIVNNKYLKVKNNNKYGIVNINGAEIIECKYDEIDIMEDNIFRISEDKICSYIDLTGNFVKKLNEHNNYEIINTEYSVQGDAFNIVVKDEKFGLYDNKGNELLPCEYDYISGCYNDSGWNNNYLKYMKNDKWGLYSLTLNMPIAPAEFDNIYNWHEENYNLIVEKDGKFGAYNEKGNIIPLIYDGMVKMRDGVGVEYFIVKNNEKLGKINVNGEEILSVKYDALFPEKYEDGHIVYVKADNKYYLINENEEILKEYTKEEAEDICNNYSQISSIMYADEKFDYYGLIRNY